METSLSRRIVRAGQEADIQTFVPPVHQPAPLPKEKHIPKSHTENRQTSVRETENSPSDLTEEIETQCHKMLEDARNMSQELVLEAKKKAGELIEKAEEQADSLREEASKEGYESGYEEGLSKGRLQAAEELHRENDARRREFEGQIQEALASVEKAKKRCIKEYLDELRDCSIAVAEKVIHISLKASGDVIRRMILAETEKLKKTSWVKIYISKLDYEMMAEADANVVEELSRLSDNIKFIVMEKEGDGSCIIETPEEIIDISVDTQMENIKEIAQNVQF
ncbi:MAG: FliH/SctL family protein [Lachnospiraceae bacterium]